MHKFQPVVTGQQWYFRESLGTAQQIFETNIAKAGFEDVVIPIRGDSSCLANLDEKVDFVFIDADHEYDSVVKDLFAVRHLITPGTLLCGHDFGSDRWPGVERAVRHFIKNYITVSNVWIAAREGIDYLLSLPDFEDFTERVELQQRELDQRYLDPQYCARHNLVVT